MNHLLPAVCAGASAGAIMLFLSHIAPKFGAGNFVRDIDQPKFFGRSVSRREGHLVGMIVHLALSAVFGGLYALGVDLGAAPGFGILPILAWGFMLAAFTGAIILPLEGHGFFGLREDAWFPLDLLLTNILWAAIFWWLMRLWLGLAVSS